MAAHTESLAGVTRERKKADEWALVLASAAIPCRVDPTPAGWKVIVGPDDAARATAVLEEYERENPRRPAAAPAPPEYGRTYAGIALALLLAAFHALTGTREGGSVWFSAGSAAAERILAGEVWRTVTALTLHSGLSHIASNAVSAAIFGTAVCRSLGPGVGLWLMLLAGTGGNAVNALVRGPFHNAVGASTGILGAIGILAALQFVNRRRGGSSRWRTWAPLAAGLALLAMLGTAAGTDILAHLFGFLAGGVLGAAAGLAGPRLPGRAAQWALTLGAAGAVAGCWMIALG